MWLYSVINLKYKVLENYKGNYPKGSQRLVEWTSQRSYIKRLGGARKKNLEIMIFSLEFYCFFPVFLKHLFSP